MRKNKLFLILSGCVTAVVGIFYLHFFGFEKSQFRVDVPKWSGISWQKPVKISRAEFMNELLSIIDWVILIGTVIIVILMVAKVVKELIVSLFQPKKTSLKVDTPPEWIEQ
jgi:hypothetical protein